MFEIKAEIGQSGCSVDGWLSTDYASGVATTLPMCLVAGCATHEVVSSFALLATPS